MSKRQKEAEKLFAFFKEEGYLDSLLANMIKFVFRSIDLNSAEVFERLLVTYEKSMQRDPELKMVILSISNGLAHGENWRGVLQYQKGPTDELFGYNDAKFYAAATGLKCGSAY